jgi:hypothetical protein
METLLVPLISAAIGWAIRHFSVIAPAISTPQTSPAGAGTVPAPSALQDLPSLIASIVSQEVQKGLARLEARLAPVAPSPFKPQT